ncbi:hypothetical protein DKP78_25110, partial [Enterococcus faecium]
EEVHSGVLEDEGIVQVPLEGHYKDDPSIVNITDEMTKASFGNVFQGLNQENAKKDMTSKSSPT